MGIATQTTILAEASNLEGLVLGHSHPILEALSQRRTHGNSYSQTKTPSLAGRHRHTADAHLYADSLPDNDDTGCCHHGADGPTRRR